MWVCVSATREALTWQVVVSAPDVLVPAGRLSSECTLVASLEPLPDPAPAPRPAPAAPSGTQPTAALKLTCVTVDLAILVWRLVNGVSITEVQGQKDIQSFPTYSSRAMA